MKIALLYNGKGTETGDSIIFASTKESKIIIDAMEEYCKNNKRKRIAKNLLKQMEQELIVYI